ncbi:MAG: hypothetical protein JWQ01_4889 [Massilia sp.]|nr:hypothetical protein [Massilia sp.]
MNDEFEGMGGSYVINEAGARALVERTREAGDEPPEPPAAAEIVVPSKPAKAGFSLPVAPAESTTTTE